MRDKNTGIKVFVPCAIAGFGSGKGCISVAANLPGDEIIGRFYNGRGVTAHAITGYKKGLSLDATQNSAVLAGNLLCNFLKAEEGIQLDIHKKIPLGLGLSSCAASAVGGVFAVNELLGRPLERYDLVPFAIEATRKFIPGTDDSQVLSIIFGGAILSRNSKNESFQKLYLPRGLFLNIFYPQDMPYETPEFISWINGFSAQTLINYTHQMCGFISSLYTSNLNLTKDSFIKNELDKSLGKNIPGYLDALDAVEKTGAIGMGIAGLGPAFYILSPNSLIAEECNELVQNFFKQYKVELQSYQTTIDMNGVRIC